METDAKVDANHSTGKKNLLLAYRNMATIQGSIRYRIALYFLLIGSLILLVGLVLTNIFGVQTVRATIGSNFQELAGVAAHRIEAALLEEYRHLKDLVRNPQTLNAQEMAQAFYQHVDQQWIEQHLKTQEQLWQAGSSDIDSEVLDSDLAQYLHSISDFRQDMVVGIVITDGEGAVLAASTRPSRYDLRNTDWWQAVQRHRGFFMSEILPTGSVFPSKAQVIELALPIFKDEQIIGVAYIALRAKVFRKIFDEFHIGKTGHVMLASGEGSPLICKFIPLGAHKFNPALTKMLTSPKPGWSIAKNDGHGGTDSIIGFAPVQIAQKLNIASGSAPQWHTLVTQDPKETYAELQALLWKVGWLGTLLLLVLGPIGLFAGKRIVKPILVVQQGARLIGTGDLQHQIVVDSQDEIGDLANEFNRMAANILQTQQELNNFADAVIHAGDGIIMTSLKGRVFFVNPAFEALTGYSAEELIGETPSKWKSNMNPDELYQEMWYAISHDRIWTGELINKRKDGTLYTAQMTVSPVSNTAGKTVSLLGVQRDVTEKRAMERELKRHHDELEVLVDERAQEIKQAKDKLESILKSANDVIITLDIHGNYKFINDRICIWGYQPDDLFGLPFTCLVVTDGDNDTTDMERNPQSLAQQIEGLLNTKINEFCIRTEDGRIRDVMATASRLDDGETLVIARDMTETKTLQRQIAKSEQLRVIGEMATMVAHDFRNPLSTIKMNLQILSSRNSVRDNEREHFALALEEVKVLEHLLTSILEYSKPSQIQLHEYDLHDSLAQVLQKIHFDLEKSNIQLELDLKSPFSKVECDTEKISQVWRNIFINAIQSMTNGGVLNVATEQIWQNHHPEILVHITDNGCGMSKNVLKRLFDPFFSMRSGGTGLGLAIVKKIIESHHGYVDVISEPGRGTEFLIALPLKTDEHKAVVLVS
ncbi:MAG TPA: PAS domain S-box protein [Gammaproteobacteria bacterium]|nr:PAS domain S-box protein [Gammaproteobacteria bacterium]